MLWAYENWRAHGHRATIHLEGCDHRNGGQGAHGGGESPNGKWHGPFDDYQEARDRFNRKPIEIRRCHICSPHSLEEILEMNDEGPMLLNQVTFPVVQSSG
jgi:hypothetical protein